MRDRVLTWVAPVLLIALASNQLYLASARDLTPWKGGGFGMFASTDRLGYRAVQATLQTEIGDVVIDIHELREQGGPAREAFSNARALMDAPRGRALAAVVVRAEWQIDEEGVARFEQWMPEGTPGPVLFDAEGELLEVHGGAFDAWGAYYDRDTRRLVPEHRGRYSFEVAP